MGLIFHLRHEKKNKQKNEKPHANHSKGSADKVRDQPAARSACMRPVCMYVVSSSDADVSMALAEEDHRIVWETRPIGREIRCDLGETFHCLSSEARWLSAALNQAATSVWMKKKTKKTKNR